MKKIEVSLLSLNNKHFFVWPERKIIFLNQKNILTFF